MSDVPVFEIESYKLKRIKEVSGSTVNRELTILKAMYNKAIDGEEWGIERKLVNKVDFYQEKNFDVKILSKDEIKRLLETVERSKNPDFKNFLTISLNTGMRKIEVLKLKWANIDF